MAESNQDIVVEADVRLPTPQSCVNQTSSERRTSDLVTASRFAFAAAANDEAEKWAQRAEHDDTFANDAAIAAALAELESLSYPAKPNATSSGQAQDDCIACLATTANARFYRAATSSFARNARCGSFRGSAPCAAIRSSRPRWFFIAAWIQQVPLRLFSRSGPKAVALTRWMERSVGDESGQSRVGASMSHTCHTRVSV
eukprot:CAMPEP_0117554274 /NCGR_PEP_ID=MMETSP0784-20121206/50669_1 /TAXON_ID=39447 /ORGANISM="" /LENGTH=199 /DNA_ID=CAMNT_0005351433 /DNA_START=103 /DNA_END=703 /DNA_ORIENTATION=+